MTDVLILLAPVFLLIVMLWFGFTGCGKPLPPDDPVAPSPTPTPYAKIIEAEQGFVVHWGLNETTGTTAIAAPAALNLNAQYLAGATPGSPGAFAAKEPGANFAAALNGTGYVEVPFSERLNLQANVRFSVEVWAKPAAAIPPGVEQILISSHQTSGGGNQRGYEIVLIGTAAGHATVRARVFSTNFAAPTIADVTPTQGNALAWRHIVLTYDGSGGPAGKRLRLWVSVTGAAGMSSQETPDAKYEPVLPGNPRPLRFGAGHLQAGGAEKFFAGLIDEVAFYDIVLPQITVETHFKLF